MILFFFSDEIERKPQREFFKTKIYESRKKY